MKKNMGSADRFIRILVALAIVGLYATGTISGTLATVLIVLAVVFVLTSMVSFCPLYTLLKISSVKSK